MSLTTHYSLWLGLACLAIGGLFSVILYYKNREIEFEKRPKIIMAVLRGISISLITFLLLAPMVKMTLKQTDKPVIVLAVDNTESLILNTDSSYYKQQYAQQVEQLIASLGDQYEIKTYLLGEHLKSVDPAEVQKGIDFSNKTTDLSSIFDEISTVFVNRNVGAMLLLSDGIYNTGSNPYYKAEKVNFPVYTVGLGNTGLITDLFISEVYHNKQTYIGNFFPVEIKVAATKLAGENAELTLYEDGNVIFSKKINLSSSQYFETIKLTLEAKQMGVHHYKAVLSDLEGEITYKNNSTSFFVEVVDSREKIAIVYQAPHPDISALKSALETADKYQVEVFSIEDFKTAPSSYSLIILHQLPSVLNSAGNLLSQIQKSGTSVLYILGLQSNLSTFNNLNNGLSVTQNKNLFNNAMPAFNENFTSFTFSEEAKQMLKNYPPIQTFFGDYRSAVSANIFMYQKINSVTTQYPLILFNDANGAKIGVITGTGIWQWKVYNYLYAQNHDAFNEMINKIALYLSSKGDKSFFRVNTQNVFDETAPIEFAAELYNDSYEIVSEPDITMALKSDDGKTYTAQFSKQNNAYYLNMGTLPVGKYQWQAKTQYGTKSYSKSGQFIVKEVVLESINLVADHALLQNISQHTEGKFYTKKDMQQIAKEIMTNDHIKPVASYNKKYTLLLNSWFYLTIIILLLAIEWFMRKWGGGY